MFTIREITAAGTFGTVCIAKDMRDGREVALKVLKKEFIDSHKVLTRTRDEARILALLDHPNIVQVFELLEFDGHPVVVMEWVKGVSLEDLLEVKADGLPLAEALEIVHQACDALDTAYNAVNRSGRKLGIIHRDIKPSNILLGVDGRVKVVDFGIAHGEFEEKEAVTVSMVLGTRQYNAPERLDGAADTMAVDVYAMGMVLFELLTGERFQLSLHPLHHSKNLTTALEAMQVPLEPALREALQALIAHMCHYDAEERPTQAECRARLEDLMKRAALTPDLEDYAIRNVTPLFVARPRLDPMLHPHWKHVRFVHEDEELLDLDTQEVNAADLAVRAHLSEPGWARNPDALRQVLEANRGWTAAPFVELLDRAMVPVWMFWRKEYVPVEHLLAALEVLRERPNPEVLRRAKQLEKHDNRQVRNRARILAQKA